MLPIVKKNCTTKFDEAIDLSFQINNKQKKNEINLRTVVNMPGGTGKKVKVAVVCEETKNKDAKDAGADIVGGDDLIEKTVPLFETILIEEALKKTGGRRQDAAKLLGWGRNTLTRKIKQLNISL